MGTAGQSITLANSIIGVGILAMPFCFQQCGVLLATVILLVMGLMSRLCCYFLLKSALIARRRNFEYLAFHVFGPAGKLAVEVGIIGFLMGTCIAYFVVVGDLGPQIIAKLLNINQSDILRTSIMVIVSLVCVLPLGLLRNVDSLNNVSAATICFYFCLVIKVIAEAASQLLAGDWHTKMEMWKPSGVLQCVPIFSMALFCQTQLFEIFESLPTLSLEKMNVVTKNAINICTCVYFTLGLFGYIAFCSHNISGNILMSLSPTMASDVIKLGFVMSLAFSFPLIIFPCRASLYSFLYKKIHPAHHDHIINNSIPETTFRCITVAIIAVALFISLLIPNIELVLGLVGSTIGVLICVVFPAACFVNVTFKNTNERVLAKTVLIIGLVIMVLGTYANLQAAENKIDRYDDKITQERIDKIVEDFFERMDKHDDGAAKADNKNKPIVKEEAIKEPEKDSAVQPPNPVPPESQSNEKHPIEANLSDKEKNIDKSLEKLVPIAENVGKVPEIHPKDLQTKLNGAKVSNSEKVEKKDIEKPKAEIIEPQPIQDKNQEKIDLMKQQQLIETIKQHGEEQKELIKEQKEILHEIIKTKKELQQNKKEKDDSEAKKIAVESIQKIANMAIQSLSGVSEKPAGDNEKKSKPLEKTANEAVQEIAKHAVEAIKEIKEVPDSVKVDKNENLNTGPNILNVPSGQNNVESVVQPNVQNANKPVNVNNVAPIHSVIAPVANQNQVPDMPHAEALVQKSENIPQANSNIQLEKNVPIQNAQPVVNQVVNAQPAPNNVLNQQIPNLNQKEALPNQQTLNQQVNQKQDQVQNQINPQQNQQVNQKQDQVQNQINPQQNQPVNQKQDQVQNLINPQQNQQVNQKQDQVQNQINPQQNQQNIQNIQNNQVPAKNKEPPKMHSHSPDEPQSYKQGEDLQKLADLTKNVAQNVPLPIAMNSNPQANQNQPSDADIKVKKDIQDVQNNGAINSVNVEGLPPRQKREVVDCTKTMSLQPQDQEICKTLVGTKTIDKNSDEILAKVDLNYAILPKHLPVDAMIHHVRSLKSFTETGKGR